MTDSHTASMLSTYYLYVEQGHTPLLSLPYWVREVAELVHAARAKSRARRLREDEAADKAASKLGVAINVARRRIALMRSAHV